MAPKKKNLPDDARDYYVHNPCTLAELARLYKGEKGCSLGNLKARSTKEKWVKQLDGFIDQIRLAADEIIVQAKAQEVASQIIEGRELYNECLANIKAELANMGATKREDEGQPNKYHLLAWKTCLEMLKEQEERAEAPSGEETGFIGLPGIDADSL